MLIWGLRLVESKQDLSEEEAANYAATQGLRHAETYLVAVD